MRKDRRRLLLGNDAKNVLTLSSYNGTANAANNSSVSFTVYEDGVLLKESDVTITSNLSWVTGSWTASTSTVKLTCTSNTDVVNTRSATITVKRIRLAKYTLTLSKGTFSLSNGGKSLYSAIVVGPSPLGGTKTVNVLVNNLLYTGSDVTISGKSGCNATISNGVITITYPENTSTSDKNIYITVKKLGVTDLRYFKIRGTKWMLNVLFSDGLVLPWAQWKTKLQLTPIGIVRSGYDYAMSLVIMDPSNPDVGKSGPNHNHAVTMLWQSSNYYSEIGCDSTTDGLYNTQKILLQNNQHSTDWQTSLYIGAWYSLYGSTQVLNGTGYDRDGYTNCHAQCCWRFHTEGTNLGDWYLPAIQQLSEMHYSSSNSDFGYSVAYTLETVNSLYNVPCFWGNDNVWLASSTEDSSNPTEKYKEHYPSSSTNSSVYKGNLNSSRAFINLPLI